MVKVARTGDAEQGLLVAALGDRPAVRSPAAVAGGGRVAARDQNRNGRVAGQGGRSSAVVRGRPDSVMPRPEPRRAEVATPFVGAPSGVDAQACRRKAFAAKPLPQKPLPRKMPMGTLGIFPARRVASADADRRRRSMLCPTRHRHGNRHARPPRIHLIKRPWPWPWPRFPSAWPFPPDRRGVGGARHRPGGDGRDLQQGADPLRHHRRRGRAMPGIGGSDACNDTIGWTAAGSPSPTSTATATAAPTKPCCCCRPHSRMACAPARSTSGRKRLVFQPNGAARAAPA